MTDVSNLAPTITERPIGRTCADRSAPAPDSTTTQEWLRRFHPAPDARVRLVCLPHAGGSASYYFPVSSALSPTMDVYAVQYPGRQDRRHEPCVDSIPDLADTVAELLVPIADRPIALFGHSMGAALSFEVSLRLQERGITPACLFMSGRRAPSTHRDERSHLLPDDELIDDLERLAGTAGQIFGDPELVRMVLPAIRTDLRAVETYQCTSATLVHAPIHALIGTDDPKATVEEACSWRDHTDGEFSLHVFPGGHFYLNEHVREVLELIGTTLRPWTRGAALRLVP